MGCGQLLSLSWDLLETSPSGTSMPVPNQSISAEPCLTNKPGFLQCKALEYSKSSGKKRKRSKSPRRKKEEKASKKQKKSKSPHRGYKRESRSISPSPRKRSRSRWVKCTDSDIFNKTDTDWSRIPANADVVWLPLLFSQQP